MSNVEEKKQDQSKFDIVKSLMIELEKVYDDFCIVNEEFEFLVSEEQYVEHRVVNGDDLNTYQMNVKQTYDEARDVFLQLKKTNQRFVSNLYNFRCLHQFTE